MWKLLGGLFFCAAIFTAYLFIPTVYNEVGINYYLKPGTSKKTFVAEIAQREIIPFHFLFSAYTSFFPNTQLKTGEYHFPKGSSPYSIWQQVTHGTGLLYHSFTIVPGWSFKQLREALDQTKFLKHNTEKWDEKAIMTALGEANLPAEGQFFPESYHYSRDVPDLVILKRAYDLMQSQLKVAWEKRSKNLPYKSAYEALIAASMVEKEAYLSAERPIIAGVLVNRLERDMLLQFDPTVIYGLGSRYNGKLHKENLLENNAYNTYVNKGLPPTPIAMPSLSSIEAAVHPEKVEYFYFVARGDGSHQFSKTLIDHNKAVNAAKDTHP